MRTPDSDRSLHKHQLFRRLCWLLVLACLLLVVPAAGAQPLPQHDAVPATAPSLGQYLNPDGSLAMPAGQAISLDPRGYRLVSGPGEALRFALVQPDANPGDENWASGMFPLRGMNDEVFALAVDAAGNLYAGGGFTTAGDHVSAYFARWTAADGVRGVTIGNYTFYANNLPVTIRVVTPGTLDRLAMQRFNRSHPQATPSLETGYYWEIVGTDANGNPASGYVVDLTLPTTFTPGADDQVCRYTGSTWDCAASAFTANSITRTGITQLSDWAAQDNIACADFDGDGTIDIDDLTAIATRWGQTSSTPGWDGRFDLRPDGRIDIVDIQLAAAQWGQGCAL